ncbi:MAG: carboxypeptidase-like regulatory domain-containing protein, partial [Myxococcota bacterium]
AAAEPSSGRACLAVTDDEGRFTLSGCPDAPFWATVSPVDPELTPEFVRLTPGERDLQITVRLGVVVEVTVTDGADQPLAGVLVEATVPGPRGAPAWMASAMRRSGRTDTHGLALLETGPPGRWSITAAQEGWIARQRDLEVTAESHRLTLVMRRARRVQGAVVDGYGSGIADSRVTVVPLGPGKGKMETLRTTTDRKGRFTLELPTTHPVRIEAI